MQLLMMATNLYLVLMIMMLPTMTVRPCGDDEVYLNTNVSHNC